MGKKMMTQFVRLLNEYCDSDERKAFLSALDKKAVSSLLLNKEVLSEDTLCNSYQEIRKDKKDELLFRFDKEEEQLGKSLLHFAGGFYILDPSSAAISYYLAPLLPPSPLVLDLCAAPGGKSIALALRRKDALILANDLSYPRALEITRNTDRLGLSSILSLSLDPERLRLAPLFDLLILDAPCSGSGMIRKDPKMAEDWSEEKVQRLLPIQERLLEKASALLKKGGILAYSTCSFSVEEDEDQIRAFLRRHPEMELLPVRTGKDILPGKDKLGYHLIPGIYDGEGIYFCFLRKKAGESYQDSEIRYKTASPIPGRQVFLYRKNEFLLPRMVASLADLPYIAPGIKIHDDSDHPKCPFDHAYSKIAKDIPCYPLTEEEGIHYANGEEITTHASVPDGLLILTYQGLRLGFGKKVGLRIKNYLPKGLRMSLQKQGA
jgi:16S rRNA C967 or C1407 C5-methylase (RsmB/RsmF family)